MRVAEKVRTSATHPLQIAEVSAEEGLGKIGVTFCPGKKQPHAATGAWDRDLATDVAAIGVWDAAVVITLVEPHEMRDLAVTDLGKFVEREQIEWLHLPIRDVSVPSAAFEEQWAQHAASLRSRLRAGFNILVHCKGGLGRAGMIACRLLIDAGIEPTVALQKVRAVRPGAVETAQQEAYVLALKPAPEEMPSAICAAINDRAIGVMLGLAVGDAVGTTLEFTRRDSKPLLTDMVGGGPFRLNAGEWTDDTAMALALADSLAYDRDLNERDLMTRFVDWHRRGSYSCTGRCFDIGVTTTQALSRFERSGDPVAGSTDPMSAGNGSLMRLAPAALAHLADAERRRDVAARQSRTTHAAAEAVDACVAYADLLAEAITGASRDAVLAPRRVDLARGVADVLAGLWRGKSRAAIKSSGYVIHSLEAALWSVARTTDFRSAVLLAANLGDDADTVAAITGQLAGALYGASAIPAEWLDKLAWRDRLEKAAQTLLTEVRTRQLHICF